MYNWQLRRLIHGFVYIRPPIKMLTACCVLDLTWMDGTTVVYWVGIAGIAKQSANYHVVHVQSTMWTTHAIKHSDTCGADSNKLPPCRYDHSLTLLFSNASAEWFSLAPKQFWHLVLLKMLGTNFRHLEAILGVYIPNGMTTIYRQVNLSPSFHTLRHTGRLCCVPHNHINNHGKYHQLLKSHLISPWKKSLSKKTTPDFWLSTRYIPTVYCGLQKSN